MAALITTFDESDALTVLGETMRPLLTNTMGSEIEVYDTVGDTDMGPPPHHHPWAETYVMLAGELDVIVDGAEPRRLGVGDAAHVPGGTSHGYRIAADDTRFLTILSRGNGEAFYRQMDAQVSFPPDFGKVAEVTGAHGITLDV